MPKNKSLGDKARTGLYWNLGGNLIKQVLIVYVSIHISRIIGPEDYGLIAIAMIFVSFSQIFVDVGFTEGIIQKKDISDDAISSVFFFNLGISTFLALLVILLAPLISAFFEMPELTDVIRMIVLVLPISALGKVHSAILTRDLRIKSLSIRDIASAIFGGVVGIYLAEKGYGVYSLVWQQLTGAVVGTILLWIGSKWLPKFVFVFHELKELLSFSIFVFFDTIVQQVFNKIDTVFVGKVFSAQTLGLYSRADSLRSLINDFSTNALSKVIFPVFSSIQDEPEKMKRVFTKAIGFILVVTTIISGVMFFSAESIIIGLLGEKWRDSITFFQILIFSTISLPLRSIVFKAILALGHSKLKFRLGLINNAIKFMSIPFGYFFGIEAFAWAVVGGRYLIVIISWIAFQNIVSFDLKDVIRPVIMPITILAAWVVLFYSNLLKFNMLFYVLPYLVSLLLMLKLSNNFGFNLLMEEVSGISSRVRKLMNK